MKKKLGIICLLLIIAASCFFVGQYNVKKNILDLEGNVEAYITTVGEKEGLLLTKENVCNYTLKMSDTYVTLEFDYEVISCPEDDSLPEDANLEVIISCSELPDNTLYWAFEPGMIEQSGKVKIDLKAFKGRTVEISMKTKGSWEKEQGIFINKIYMSKMYI